MLSHSCIFNRVCEHMFIIIKIYGNEYKKEVIVYRLPLWRDLTMVQKLAYFFYFMVETKDFENITAFERPKDGGT